MAVTVPVPALLLLAVSLFAARARGFRYGLLTGALALVFSLAVVVAAVVAVEGQVWIAQLLFFILDAGPPGGSSTKVRPGAILSGLPSLSLNWNSAVTEALVQVPCT